MDPLLHRILVAGLAGSAIPEQMARGVLVRLAEKGIVPAEEIEALLAEAAGSPAFAARAELMRLEERVERLERVHGRRWDQSSRSGRSTRRDRLGRRHPGSGEEPEPEPT